MSSAEKRSEIDGDDDGIVDIGELRLELAATESDAMESLSLDAVEVDGFCEAQKRGDPEDPAEGDDKDTNENSGIDDDSNDGPSTSDSDHDPDQDFGIESDTDGLREEASRGNEGHEIIETHVLDDSGNRYVNDGRDVDVDVDEYDEFGVRCGGGQISGDSHSDCSELLSHFEAHSGSSVVWPIEDPQVIKEKRESKNKANTATAEILNPNLCKFCRVFFDTWSSVCEFMVETNYEATLVSAHHDSLSDLKASASGGCHLCAIFLNILHITHFGAYKRDKRLLLLDGLKPYRIQLWNKGVYLGGEISDDWCLSLAFWSINAGFRKRQTAYANMVLDNVSDSGYWKTQSYIDTNLGQKNLEGFRLGCTEKSTGLVRTWLQNCDLNHSACRQQKEAFVLPTRLVKIDCQEIRLCISANENCSKYATLSHCWGKAEVLRLQKYNYQAFLKKIPYDKLCKTFRDAIDIARVLGFSWLWIDSLCIIQGDSEDWSKEASRMSTVYGLSSLNIAATAAPDGTIGCLFERNLRYTEAVKVAVKTNHQKQVYKIEDKNLYENNIIRAPLTTRAWVVQERILAPRTLHFTRSQIFWECRTNQACESYPHTLPNYLCEGPSYLPKEEYQSWTKIIYIYTNCSLTNDSDCLVAIGGVARQIQKKTGDKYYAGLWKERIKEQLCWMVDGWSDSDGVRCSGRNTWRAPSWSWAAARQRVDVDRYGITFREAYIDVIKVDITAENDDPFGCIKSGVLTIRSKSMIIFEMKSLSGRPDPKFHGLSSGNVRLIWDHEYCCLESYYKSILILPIGIKNNTFEDRVMGLLLRPTLQENGQYERLGSFIFFERTEHCKIVQAMNLPQHEQFEELGLLENGGALPSEKDYISTDVDEDGITWYTISII
ncbi:hypothetical protein ACHAO1_006574 [Botrytis cinerea]